MDILKSRRFWTMLVGIATALLLHYFGGTDTQFLIQTLTPLVMLVIAAYTVDDIADIISMAIVERASLLAGDGKQEMLVEEVKDAIEVQYLQHIATNPFTLTDEQIKKLATAIADETTKANNGL